MGNSVQGIYTFNKYNGEEINRYISLFSEKSGEEVRSMEMNCITLRRFSENVNDNDDFKEYSPSIAIYTDGVVGKYNGRVIRLNDYLPNGEVVLSSWEVRG